MWRSCTNARVPRCNALRVAIQSARNGVRIYLARRAFVRRKVEEELRYAASEARREGQASCIRARNRRGILGGVDRRIARGYTTSVSHITPRRIDSRYTLAEYGAVSDPLPR